MNDPIREHLTTPDLAYRADYMPPARDEDTRARLRQDEDFQGVPAKDDGMAPLFQDQDLDDLRSQWTRIQTGFVDEPRKSVEEADGLVAATIERLAESFTDERTHLEEQWSRGGDASTEDLRLASRRYRSFFDRLLSV